MPRRKKNSNPQVTEAVKIAVEVCIKKFLNTDDSKEWEFPSCFSNVERAYIHTEALRNGLKSKSRGSGDQRCVTIYKREGSAIVQKDAILSLTNASRALLIGLFNNQPVTVRERQECLPPLDRTKDNFQDGRYGVRSIGRLMAGVPQMPTSATNKAFAQFRSNLPVYGVRDTILQTISDNQVTIITGPTGTGKTTQVPQYLLEWHEMMGRVCRIVVTQPRRISAVSVSERVALERGEKLGNTIGYQIRLEGKVCPSTVVTFCTVGVLVRTLICGDGALSSVSHIIVDEVHERDRLSDFLLLVLREALARHRALRLVLMSASTDTNKLSAYFNNCPIIPINKKAFDVKEYYLEDVLRITNFMGPELDHIKSLLDKKKSQTQELDKWRNVAKNIDSAEAITASINNMSITPGKSREMDIAICDAWAHGSLSAFHQIIHLIQSESVSPDYQHSDTSLTGLMVAAARGNLEIVEQLFQLGASPSVKACNNNTALDFAKDFNQTAIYEFIKQQMFCEEGVLSEEDKLQQEGNEMLELYNAEYSSDAINVNLILALIQCIHAENSKGSILVFLPGYEDIVNVRNAIMGDEKKLSSKGKIVIFLLHSNMQTSDQKLVFKPVPQGTRKIILSTNIAETSITIEDVVFVIDTGKMREKMFNAMTGIGQLCTVWESKSCAEQRKGRAGRTQAGVCYRLFSQLRYNAMEKFKIPEIVHIPIPDLCLFSKLLAPANTSIVDFLSKAMDPPSSVVTRSAVTFLKTIDALDTWEDLTDLGHHLIELPVDPKYGKMLIYGALLKCLDPILTIVCCLTYRDLFTIPVTAANKKIQALEKQKFSSGSLSDHMTCLRAFQEWQEARREGRDRAMCRERFISGAAMEMVVGTRAQVLTQLRLSGFIRNKGPGDIKSVNSNSDNWAVVKAAIVAGLYPNIARLDRDHSVLRTQKVSKVELHNTSVLIDSTKRSKKNSLLALPTDWVVFEEMNRIAACKSQILGVTAVSPITIAIFAGPSKIPVDAFSHTKYESEESDSEEEDVVISQTAQMKLDDWLMFRLDPEVAELVQNLRIKWHSLLTKKLKSLHKSPTPVDDLLINSIVGVLSLEEQAIGLKQPSEVGRRPYPITLEATSVSVSQCRYFVIKANQVKLIETSIANKTWSFSPYTISKVLQAYKSGKTVVLVFTVQGSGQWQGFARLAGDRTTSKTGEQSSGACLPVEWVRHSAIPYHATKHLPAPAPHAARDGQELECNVGEALCQLWESAGRQWNQGARHNNRQGRQPTHVYHNSNIKS